ncbi:MAG TPA: GatB/YqeY domain-containing protein [Actinomycetota bacterium]|nr:GatB/YqeY domain-containing protein [Actinomycetota bacterium]
MGRSTLKDQVHREMTAALRAGDKVRLGAFRMLAAAIVNREKDVLHELSDEEVREVAAKEVKRRNESIEAFESAGRTELAEKERAEREVLQPYAPEQLGEAEVDALIEEAIRTTGATSAKELGKVMGAVMGTAKGRVDGAVVQAKVRERLGRGDER